MQDTAPRHVDVVIVGAGLAGLAAADRLRHSGLSVTVLEADDRIGGRTFGAYWAPAGRDIDLGGTWLLPGFTQTQALLGEFGIPTRDSPPVAEPLTHLSGGVSVRATASAAEAETLDTIAGELRTLIAQSPRALSAEEALDELSVSGFALDWHRATQRYLAGAGMSQIDASHLLIAPQDLRDPDHYATQITGTTRALVDALANRSAADLRLGCVVDRVEQHGAGYRVRTRAGAAWAAAAVILAVPRNVLAGITVPATIQAGTAALAAVPHAGAARKDWFVLDGVTDHFRVFASEGTFGYFRSEARLPDGGILAVALTPSAEGAPRVLDMEAGMRQYLPGVVVRAHLSHDWVASPWAGGTWWVPVPGDPALHPDAQADLASADGRLHLVGGDVCPDFPGTLEGALRTGIAAAESVERLFAAHARGTAHAQITESPTH